MAASSWTLTATTAGCDTSARRGRTPAAHSPSLLQALQEVDGLQSAQDFEGRTLDCLRVDPVRRDVGVNAGAEQRLICAVEHHFRPHEQPGQLQVDRAILAGLVRIL